MRFLSSRRRFVSLVSLATMYALKPSWLLAEKELPDCLSGNEIAKGWQAAWNPEDIRLQVRETNLPQYTLRRETHLYHIPDEELGQRKFDEQKASQISPTEALDLQIIFDERNTFYVMIDHVPRTLRVRDALYLLEVAQGKPVRIWKKTDSGHNSKGSVVAGVRLRRGEKMYDRLIDLESEKLSFGLNRDNFLEFFHDGKEPLLLEYIIDRRIVFRKEYNVNGLLEAYSNAFGQYLEQKKRFDNEECAYIDCFLTTAACGALQLEDDCWELTQLRHFRDSVMQKTEEGRRAIAQYYALAPLLVKQMNRNRAALFHYYRIYWRYILPCALLSFLHLEKACFRRYQTMVVELEQRFMAHGCTKMLKGGKPGDV